MQAKGYRVRTVFDYEDAFGVSPAVKKGLVLPFNSNEIAETQNTFESGTITDDRNSVKQGRGRKSAAGQIVVPMDLNAIGYWLTLLLGFPATTGAGPYTHVFKVNNNALPSAVIAKEFQDIGKVFVYNGCKAGSFKLPFGGDGELVATMDIAGQKRTVQDAAYDAAATSVVLDRINQFQASIKEGGATIGTVLSGDLNINNALDLNQYVVGPGNVRGDIPEGIAAAGGTLKTIFDGTALIEKGISVTESSLELKYTSGANSLTFLFPEIQYDVVDVPVTSAAGLSADLTWKAYKENDAAASIVVITLINSIASYANT